MNIVKIEKGFTSLVHIGVYSIILYLDKTGIFMPIDKVYEECIHFNNVIVKGNSPLLQKDDLGKLFKKLIKDNSNIHFEIHTDSLHKPTEVNSYKDNVVFYIYIPLRNVGLTWEQRINESNISWYGELNSNFIFKVKDLDDVEEVVTLTGSLGIKKSKTFLIPVDNFDIIKEHIKFYSFNIASEVDWNE